MTCRNFTKSTCVLIGVVVAILCMATFQVVGQQSRAALLQTEDAGESVDDDPADTGEPVVVPETADDEETSTLTPAERAQALERRAGEQVGDDPRGRAVVVGMHLQESDNGRAKVIEVGAASPAFDAGIREGDEIVSFEGFAGKTYREWIDGIRKLATDTPDGELMTVDVLRGGKRVSIEILAPEARAHEPRVPGLLGQQIFEEGAAGTTPIPGGPNQPLAPGAVTDNDVFISSGPLFGNELDDAFIGATERAMAEIRRLNEPPQTAPQRARPPGDVPPGTPSNQPVEATDPQPGAPTTPGGNVADAARIGLAGFRDNQNGMLVMLDVGGLAPGNYRVSIDDPSLVMGGPQAGAPSVGIPPQSQQPGTSPQRVRPDGRSAPGSTGAAVTRGTAPSGTAGAAQQTLPADQADPTAGTPPTGKVQPRAGTPSGLPTAQEAAQARQRQPRQPNAGQQIQGRQLQGGGRPHDSGAAAASASTLAEVGILTVDQSGTGRLQQVVEAIQVRDVVGQAILIYPPAVPPETTLPPSTGVSGVAGTPNAASAQNRTNPQGAAAARQVPGAGESPSSPAPRIGQATGQTNRPIAGGVIRLISDRRPQDAAPTAAADGAQPADSPQDQQPRQPTNRAGRAASQPAPEEQNPTR